MTHRNIKISLGKKKKKGMWGRVVTFCGMFVKIIILSNLELEKSLQSPPT